MPTCLTCFREYRLEQVHYRCINPDCTEEDKILSTFMWKTLQMRGHAIVPPSQGWPADSVSRQKCPNPKCGMLTTLRICPHCHGQLPTYLDDVPGHSVYVLGPKGCGKSVYLLSTIKHLKDQVFPICLRSHFELSTEHTKEKYETLRKSVLDAGVLLPPTDNIRGTPELLFPFILHAEPKSYRPYFWPIIRKKPVNIAVFDISGEVCSDLPILQQNCPNLPNCSALIIIIDPTYYPNIRMQLPVEAAKASIEPSARDPQTVIDSVTQFLRSANGNKRVSIPTAFVVTKIDALKYVSGFHPSNPIFESNKHKRGYNATYCADVSQQLKSFLADQRIGAANVVEAARNNFSNHLFFGVSSLGHPPIEKRADNISPKNTESPWLWILYKLGFLSEVF